MFKLFNRKSQPKIFCISFQRTGTTSVGQFFREHGYRVAGYEKERSLRWAALRLVGNYEAIFNSKEFIEYQVFEDNPWWEGDFYKVLYHRFPDAKFILFTRDADKWFDSMVSHSNGKTLGNTFRHSKNYHREEEFYAKFPDLDYYKTLREIDNLMFIEEKHRAHYKAIYNLRNREVLEFFKAFSPDSLFIGELEEEQKWVKLGAFFGIEVSEVYNVHANKTLIK
ncbi:sulfotransferase [Aestuariibaculum suncheonense]|uniref:Sulfotransferase family protein n=1 Tax=Aestuariibaculum suncheonense TaxID=1028745 RepID=A0A8J6QIM0_9FLAO|nr:sulfotransferase [Aestuariibaculum suncheonense]MBD0837018.1 hypothetical protein [Aestuariibaculum suncheonense]